MNIDVKLLERLGKLMKDENRDCYSSQLMKDVPVFLRTQLWS